MLAFAHCLRAEDEPVRAEARARVVEVCGPDGPAVLALARHLHGLGGWGRGVRRAIAGWYEQLPEDALVQACLHQPAQARWTHRDVLRLVHPRSEAPLRNAAFQWLTRERWPEDGPPPPVPLDQPPPATSRPQELGSTWVALDVSGTMAQRALPGTSATAGSVAQKTALELCAASRAARLLAFVADGWSEGRDAHGRHSALAPIPEAAHSSEGLARYADAARMSAPDPSALVRFAHSEGAQVDLLVVISTVFTREDRARAVRALDTLRSRTDHPTRLALVGLIGPTEGASSPSWVLETAGYSPQLIDRLNRFGRFEPFSA